MTTQSTRPAAPPRLLFAGGGTGGHLFPGIAVADCWRSQFPDSDILFVGSNRPLEQQILQQAGYANVPLPLESPGRLLRHPLSYLRHWRTALRTADTLLTSPVPTIVIGLGGFASYPLLRQARRRKIPYLLLEQNAVPGRATTYFARRAACICTSFNQTARHLPRRARVITTGNPIRAAVTSLTSSHSTSLTPDPVLLVCGGSQGSRFLNQCVRNLLQQQPASLDGLKIRHQTGPISSAELSALKEDFRRAQIEAEFQTFYPTPESLYRNVSLAICRAGGTTLAELQFLGIPALLIPIANSIRNHQSLNAAAFQQQASAIILAESACESAEQLASAVRQLRQMSYSPENFRGSQHRSHTTSAAAQVVHEIQSAISRS